MAFPVLDTPRTDFGASVTQHPGDFDNFSTQDSIPSPSKESNDLLKQIRGMRRPEAATPQSRLPLTERRNVPARSEFTPLLKSATRNRRIQTSGTSVSNQENDKPPTPAGFRESYRSDVGELPVNSSMLMEEETGSSAGDMHATPHLPLSSSSVLTTPMPGLRGNNGADGGNLATLREQEARLEQIDKENFGLKLKIHFLEEALRKSGKDFNEAALKENTELKVDKVQLQRELKQQRKRLAEAQHQLEEYRRQLVELMEKAKSSGGSDLLRHEVQQLRQTVADKEHETKSLQDQLGADEDKEAEVRDLKDDVSDLEQQLRAKENEIEEKQEEIERLKELHVSPEDVDSLRQKIDEKDAEIKALHDEDDNALEQKNEELRELREDVSDLEQDIRAKDLELEETKEALEKLKQDAKDAASNGASNQELDELRDQLSEKEDEIVQLGEDCRRHEEALRASQTQAQDLTRQVEESVPVKELQDAQQVIQHREQDLRTNRQELQLTQQRLSDKEVELTRLTEQARSTASSVELELRQEIHERKQEIERLSESIQDLQDDVQSYENALRQADQDTERKLREKDRQLELKDDEVQRLEDRVDSLEQEQKQKTDDAQGYQSELNRAHGAAHRARDDAESQVREKERALAAMNDELRRLQEELKNADDNQQSLGAKDHPANDRTDEIERLKRELNEAAEQAREDLAEKDEELKELQDELKVANREQSFAAKNEELRDMQDEVDQLKRQLQDVEAQVVEEAEAKEDEMKVMEEDHQQAVSRLQRLLDEAQSRWKELDEARSSWDRQRSSLETEKLKAEARVTNLEFDIAQQHDRTTRYDENQHNARSDVQRKLSETVSQMAQLRREKQSAEDSLAATNDDLRALQADLTDAQVARSEAQQTVRDLRKQLAEQQRQSHLALQNQTDTHEADIAALDQELDSAQSKIRESTAKNESLTSSITRLKSKLADAETDLAAARTRKTSPGATTSMAERRDLHDMLRDAKVNAEDLALQLKDSDQRATSASMREADLRAQLQRIRAERKDATQQANATAESLAALQDAHDALADELDTLKRAQRLAKANSPKPSQADLAAARESQRQHQRELRGLARQIEYLAARLRREESFRRDLAFGKRFATRLLEVYSRYHKLDLALVRDMGVPVADVRAEAARGVAGRARVQRRAVLPVEQLPVAWAVDATPRGRRSVGTPAPATRLLAETRPSLRSVGMMVLAGVRMRRAAEKWAGVRAQHEGLLKKLATVRKERRPSRAFA